jgi:hypothetical protein
MPGDWPDDPVETVEPVPVQSSSTRSVNNDGACKIVYNDAILSRRPSGTFSRTSSVIGGGSSDFFQASVIAQEIQTIEEQLALGAGDREAQSAHALEEFSAQSVHDIFANILRIACKLKRRIVSLLDRMLAPKYVFVVSNFTHCSAAKYMECKSLSVYSEGRIIAWRSSVDRCLEVSRNLVDLIERVAVRMQEYHIYLERKPLLRPQRKGGGK